MRNTRRFCDGWIFSRGFPPEAQAILQHGETVRLPHNAVDLPLNYFDECAFQQQFCYQKILDWSPEFEGKDIRLRLDGAMADSVVYLNGARMGAHADGYTPFEIRLTGRLQPGSNLLSVRVSGEENPEIPPFGGHVDYLTYAGLYRDAWLVVTGRSWIDSMKIETPDPLAERKRVLVRYELAGDPVPEGSIRCRIVGHDGVTVADRTVAVRGRHGDIAFSDLEGIELWDIATPVLYRAELDLATPGCSDALSASFGFRAAVFTADGFLLNGAPLKIVGLNRHQSFPYVGYAMGRRAQERDAEILKHELNCNLVRTSHYPQSPWFLDHCDRIGLLVFEEIPGWQHVGGDGWKQESIRNVSRMIRRDWNHPSVVLWGVRINESPDDREFYQATNRLARELDATRQTAGVRNFVGSEFLEDVYTMNDFVIGQEEQPWVNAGRIPLRDQQEVTCLNHPVPYLVTEFNGHMHPTKIWDAEQRQIEHVTRYLQVLNAAHGDRQISGCIGWCMSDYNTHREFGSGDRICHHGVLDMFRQPKFAAGVYASQADPAHRIVLNPVTWWARGERSIGGVLPLTILTNCDAVELRLGDGFTKRFEPDRRSYPHLPHPPVVVGHGDIPPEKLGSWGHSWPDASIVGFLDGQEVAEVRMSASPVATRLVMNADSDHLLASEKDAARVTVRALDQVGQVTPFLADVLHVELDGPARLIGPANLAFRCGIASFWIESTGHTGSADITVTSERFQPVRLKLDITEQEICHWPHRQPPPGRIADG